jgi:hypothetical protein
MKHENDDTHKPVEPVEPVEHKEKTGTGDEQNAKKSQQARANHEADEDANKDEGKTPKGQENTSPRRQEEPSPKTSESAAPKTRENVSTVPPEQRPRPQQGDAQAKEVQQRNHADESTKPGVKQTAIRALGSAALVGANLWGVTHVPHHETSAEKTDSGRAAITAKAEHGSGRPHGEQTQVQAHDEQPAAKAKAEAAAEHEGEIKEEAEETLKEALEHGQGEVYEKDNSGKEDEEALKKMGISSPDERSS